ncbi:transcription termination/antitermination NusG family protein [Agrobacterium rhizogenes]|uniref:transcription termination/antitermination protein NusG n=1 Tax=Rhizobium rhizogenes TaxID=359 RepID=UPI0022B64BDA|nr:transcription termination/antitermination NusG family protein [Rhizobium rhizogenes]MCZ7451048.1 transcription termination/antitermination NusG family protein [Rhizobium rhizogenes]
MPNKVSGARAGACAGDGVEPSQWSKNRMTRALRLSMAQLSAASAKVVAEREKEARWYCLAVHGGHEFAVEKRISDAGVEIFVPQESWVTIKKGQKIEGKSVLLPGYALVRIVPSAAAFQGLLKQKSVFGFVGRDACYHIVRDVDVAVLKGISDRNEVSRMPVDRTIGQGSRATITHGHFAGHECIVVQVMSGRTPRARVRVEAFGGGMGDVTMALAFLKKL